MSTRHGPKLTRRQTIPLMALAVSGGTRCGHPWPERKQHPRRRSLRSQSPSATNRISTTRRRSLVLNRAGLKTVGITLAPDNQGIVVGGDEALAVFASGRVDVLSGSAQLLMPATDRLPPFKMFFFADIFQGYAILAQPDGNYTSFTEFIDQGMTPTRRFRPRSVRCVARSSPIRRRPRSKASSIFSLAKGGVTLADMETNVAEDSANVALMQGGRADFQVGGVPSRLTLESAGFKPVLTSADLAQYAEASTDSAELRAVFHDGWLATDEWLEANHDTALRMASVGFRINAFIASNPEDAMAIHTPFLNSVAGTDFDNNIARSPTRACIRSSPSTSKRRGTSIPENPLNGEYVIGSAIKLYEEQGVFQPDQHQWSDFSIAHEIYQELVDYRDRASGIIEELQGLRKRAAPPPISWPKRSGTSRSSITSTPSGLPRRRRRPGRRWQR